MNITNRLGSIQVFILTLSGNLIEKKFEKTKNDLNKIFQKLIIENSINQELIISTRNNLVYALKQLPPQTIKNLNERIRPPLFTTNPNETNFFELIEIEQKLSEIKKIKNQDDKDLFLCGICFYILQKPDLGNKALEIVVSIKNNEKRDVVLEDLYEKLAKSGDKSGAARATSLMHNLKQKTSKLWGLD